MLIVFCFVVVPFSCVVVPVFSRPIPAYSRVSHVRSALFPLSCLVSAWHLTLWTPFFCMLICFFGGDDLHFNIYSCSFKPFHWLWAVACSFVPVFTPASSLQQRARGNAEGAASIVIARVNTANLE